MYRSFFGLCIDPFGASPDPRFLFIVPQVRENLACLRYGITGRKGFVVMTGEVGTGKTTLLKSALSSLTSDLVSTAFVFNPCLDVLDFFEFILNDFGINPVARNKSAMLLQFNRWLIDRFRNRGLCVIVIDEAQNLSCELLEEIRLLTNLETSSNKLVQIVLSGQPEFEETLKSPSIRQLRQRIWMWCKTRPFLPSESLEYISERLRTAGANSPIFTSDALQLVHAVSRGIPRVINLICEHALINAYVEQVKPVPARMIEEVSSELALNQGALAVPSRSSGGPTEITLQDGVHSRLQIT